MTLRNPFAETGRTTDPFLLPPDFPRPSTDHDWLVIADWWEEYGDSSRSTLARELAMINEATAKPRTIGRRYQQIKQAMRMTVEKNGATYVCPRPDYTDPMIKNIAPFLCVDGRWPVIKRGSVAKLDGEIWNLGGATLWIVKNAEGIPSDRCVIDDIAQYRTHWDHDALKFKASMDHGPMLDNRRVFTGVIS